MGAELVGVGQVVVLLVQRHPVLHLAGEALIEGDAVVLEVVDDAPVFPAAVLVLQGLGQIPVIEGQHRLYAVGQQGIDEPFVEGEPRLVHLTAPIGEDARPAHREAVGLEPHLGHQRHVLFHAVVVIHRHVTVAALEGLARQLGEEIPHRGALAVFVPGPFHLVGGRGGPPEEICGEVVELGMVHLACLLLLEDGAASPPEGTGGRQNELASASNSSRIPSNDNFCHSIFQTGMKES